MSTRRLVGIVILLVCAAMIAYGLLVQKTKVYSVQEDGRVVREVGGGKLIYESVRQSIRRDAARGLIVENQPSAAECPT